MNKYVTGTEPNQPDQKPQEAAEQTISGVSGTTITRKRTDPATAHERIKKMKQLLKEHDHGK